MPNQRKPLVVVIRKQKKSQQVERVIELPLPQYQSTSAEHREPEPTRGVTILNIYGDEKI